MLNSNCSIRKLSVKVIFSFYYKQVSSHETIIIPNTVKIGFPEHSIKKLHDCNMQQNIIMYVVQYHYIKPNFAITMSTQSQGWDFIVFDLVRSYFCIWVFKVPKLYKSFFPVWPVLWIDSATSGNILIDWRFSKSEACDAIFRLGDLQRALPRINFIYRHL